jgi:hypothetical protein
MVFSQTRDLSQKSLNIIGPNVVRGPLLSSPLSALTESFEALNFPANGWVKANPVGGTGWARITAGTTPLPGWTGGTVFFPDTSFGKAAAYCTWSTGGATANDQWLISPKITNVQPKDSLYFWLWKFGGYKDNFNVALSTTGASPDSMSVLAASYIYTVNDTGWIQYKINIGSLVPAGSNLYIGFEEYVVDNAVDGDFILLDKIQVTSSVTSVKDQAPYIPSAHDLKQNYPNPFNPTTNIRISLAAPSKVSLRVFNLLGQQVALLLNGNMSAGNHTVDFNAAGLPSGVYLYKLDLAGADGSTFSSVKKMILSK